MFFSGPVGPLRINHLALVRSFRLRGSGMVIRAAGMQRARCGRTAEETQIMTERARSNISFTQSEGWEQAGSRDGRELGLISTITGWEQLSKNPL